jgi:two-component sensor histidine kinase
MAMHELATNALKYGALSREAGRVRVSWGISKSILKLEWEDRGGPTVRPPAKAGFGTRLLERGLLQPPTGGIQLAFPPEGMRCSIWAAV